MTRPTYPVPITAIGSRPLLISGEGTRRDLVVGDHYLARVNDDAIASICELDRFWVSVLEIQ